MQQDNYENHIYRQIIYQLPESQSVVLLSDIDNVVDMSTFISNDENDSLILVKCA